MKKGKELAVVIMMALLPVLILTQVRDCHHDNTFEAADSVFQKGERNSQQCNFHDAYRCFSDARSLYHSLGKEDKAYQSLKGMASCAFYSGELDESIDCLKECLAMARKTNDTAEEYEVYLNLYTCYQMKEDFERVMTMDLKMDSVAANSGNSRIKFHQLNRLAKNAGEQKHWKLQEYYLNECERLITYLPNGIRSDSRILLYNEMREFYSSRQDLKKAIKYSRLAIEEMRNKRDKNGFDYLAYGNEAILCARQFNSWEAFKALDSMKSGLERYQSPPVCWMFYHAARGEVWQIMNKWDVAQNAYENAINVMKDNKDHMSFCYYDAMLKLGDASCFVGQFDKARACFEKYASFYRSQFGEENPYYIHALWILARLEASQHNVKKGCDYYVQSVNLAKRMVSEQMRYVNIQQRDTFWHMMAPIMYDMTSFSLKNKISQKAFVEKCYEALLFSKSLLLASERSMAEAINDQCTKEERRIYYEMMSLQTKLKALTKDEGKNAEQIGRLHKRISALDKRITPIASRLAYTDFLNTSYADIKQMLGENEALIDYIDFVPEGERRHPYAAFVIERNQGSPLLRELYDEIYIEALMEDGIASVYQRPYGTWLLKVVFEPFQDALRGKDTIYYVPSGLLHQVALESLPMKDGSLLGDHYHFVRLTSAREIARVKRQAAETNGNSTATLYGGLQYDVDSTAMAQAASHYPTSRWIVKTRGGGMRGDGSWGQLANTQKEIDEIERVLAGHRMAVQSRTGAEGTEESFFTMSGKAPKVLHIATHGFYYTPDGAKEVAYLNGYQDAMQLSGLILSGGNAEWTGKPIPKGVMGGVLTANDIATTDLKGTDLVVLSACQTGQGKATPEGVYGLQRAFKKAGAQTIVMTLWNVSDRATKDFMVKFYEGLDDGDNHWNKRKAFERAKQYIREKYKNPHYWAGFVMLD